MLDSSLRKQPDKDGRLLTEKYPVLLILIISAPTTDLDPVFIHGMRKLAPDFRKSPKFPWRGIWVSGSTGARATAEILSQAIWPSLRIITNPDLGNKRHNEIKKEAKERIYRAIRMIAQHAFDTRNAAIILHPRILQLFLTKIIPDTTMPLMRPGSISYMIYHQDTDSFSVIELNKTTHLDDARTKLRFLHKRKNHT